MQRLFGVAAWIVPLAIYLASLQGVISYWDTGESQVVPWIFGIAHPTGFPAFTIAAGVFAHVFPLGTVAWRIAFFSAIAMSAAAWAIFRALRELRCDPWIALAAACVFAFGIIVWTRGTRAEVHALSACFAALTLLCAVRWYLYDDTRALQWGGLCLGLGIATHPVVGLMSPGLAVLLLGRVRRLQWRAVAAAFAWMICGLTLYAYLPIRSAMVTAAKLDPTVALGDPPGRAFWDMNHPASWAGFKSFLSGSDYGAGGVFASLLSPQTYLSGAPPFFEQLWREFTPVALLLALAGVVTLARRDLWLAAGLIAAAAMPAAFAFGYTIEADIARYYLIPFLVAALLTGYGAEVVARMFPPLRVPTILMTFGVALGLLVFNRDTFSQRYSLGAEPMIAGVRARTVDRAVLLAPWINSTALAYASYVDRTLGNRIVDSAWLQDEKALVPRWIEEGRHVYIVGQVFGSVPRYHTVKISQSPEIYEVLR